MTTAHARRVQLAIAAVTLTAAVSICFLANGTSSVASGAQKEDTWPKSADPLFPKSKDDVSTGYAACAACHAQTRPVNEKVNIFAKNFKSHQFVFLSEGGTWITQDPHSAAYRALSQPLGLQMAKILKYDVTKAPQCLTCHAIDKYPGMPFAKDMDIPERFGLGVDENTGKLTGEGVTCNACHGVRKLWQGEHYADQNKTIPWRTKTPEYKEKAGMRNLRDPVVKAQLCASCHVGSPELNRVVTHDMYAAGHPPLPPFELGTFMECEPQHWGYPTDPDLKFFTDAGIDAYLKSDYAKDHPNWTWELYRFFPADKEVYMARQLTAGAVASLHAEMKLIAADAEAVARGEEGSVDFARFDCYACHHDLKIPSDRQARGYAGPPGRPPLKAWTAALPGVVVDHAVGLKPFADATKDFHTKWNAVQAAALARPFGKPKDLSETAKAMAGWCDDFMKRQQTEASPVYTKQESEKLLKLIGDAAVSERWIGDPEAAMHLTWAYITLRGNMKMDIPKETLEKLAKKVPVRVREMPYSDNDGNPVTVGATLRQRLDLFNKFNAKDFSSAFGDVLGPPKK